MTHSAPSRPFALIGSQNAVRAGYASCDWSATSVGSPDQWPTLLRNSIALMLDSQFPMFVIWGPGQAFLYNVPYIPLLGEKHPACLGQAARDVWPDLWPGVEPMVTSAFAGKPTFRKDVARRLLRDGRYQNAWFTLSYSPIRDEEGTVAGALCVISETTERVLLERRQLLQLQLVDRLRQLPSAQEVIRTACGLLGEYLDVPRVFHAEVDATGANFQVNTDWARDGATTMAGLTARLDDYGREAVATLRAGQALVISDIYSDPRTVDHAAAYARLGVRSLLASPLVKEGKLVSMLNVFNSGARHWSVEDMKLAADIAERTWSAVERIQAEEALRRADRRKDEFLAMLAHELRNPLAPISAAARLLKIVAADPQQVTRTSNIIARQVDHMTGLIDDLLDVSRVTRGLVVLDMNVVDMGRVIADAVEQVKPLIDGRRHQFSINATAGPALVRGDYKRLVQVLANLLNNAAKYTPDGGRLALSMKLADDQIELTVADSGIGLTPELLPTLFQLFSQAERTPDRAQGGLGLGLALVKMLVELHGGSVGASSKGRDAGSEFTVRLPRLHGPATESPTVMPQAAQGGHAAAARPLRLLVVDDNVDAAQMLALLMQASGHQVVTAHAPQEALAHARQAAFDACLLDIGLPGMDGNELAQQLRKLPGMDKALFIAVSGYGQQFDRKSALEAGFQHYFVKPADPAELLALLARIES